MTTTAAPRDAVRATVGLSGWWPIAAVAASVRPPLFYVFILYLLVTAADDFDASRDVQVIGSHFSDCSLLGNLGDRR